MSEPTNIDAISVLLVEDSPSDADVLEQSLRRAGAGRFHVTWVERLDDAMTLLPREAFDVMLLDLSLPDSSGPDTFRRAQAAAPRLPIVVLTGVTDESVGLAAVREGVQDYLVKGQADGRQIARAIRYAIERKQADEAVRTSRRQFAALVEHSPDLITRLDGNLKHTYVSPRALEHTGIAPERFLGKTGLEAGLSPDLWAPFAAACEAALSTRQPQVHESMQPGADGVHYFETRIIPERGPDGGVESLLAITTDLTKRKRTEDTVRHQNAVLEGINRILSEALTCKSEEELGSACLAVAEKVSASSFGFIGETAADGLVNIIALSDPTRNVCQIAPAANGTLSMAFEDHDIAGRILTGGAGFFTNEPQPLPDSIGLPEGYRPLTSFVGAPLQHGGKTIGMIGLGNREGGYTTQDVEALEALAAAVVQVFMRKRAETAMRASEERLRHAQKMESIGLLAGGVAHDFNNLLTSILGNASMLRDEVGNESLDKLSSVMGAAEKAADLTRQLLAYAGKGRFLIEPLNFSLIVRDVTDLLRATVPKKVQLKLALTPDLPRIEADSGQLQQILMNLVINGAEAIGAEQTGTVTIATRAQEVSEKDRLCDVVTGHTLTAGTYICLEVVDSGCGMNAETRAKIFDPFFTTKFMGRGLGLAAVAGIVQAQAGAIELDTAPGKGATFRVFLPAMPSPAASRRRGRRLNVHGAATVLVVGDEPIVREFIGNALKRYGYKVLFADDGREAVRVFSEKGTIDLVLLDLTMPVMGGDEAIVALKNRGADLKTIVMSGYSESEVMKAFAGKGVSAFLHKPFTAALLIEVVKAVLTEGGGQTC